MSRPGVFPWKTIRHLHHTTEIRTNCNHAKANGFLRHYVKKVMTHRRRSSVQYVPAKKHQDCKSYGTESNTSLHLSLHILLLHPGAGGVILLNCLWKSIRTKIVARHWRGIFKWNSSTLDFDFCLTFVAYLVLLLTLQFECTLHSSKLINYSPLHPPLFIHLFFTSAKNTCHIPSIPSFSQTQRLFIRNSN